MRRDETSPKVIDLLSEYFSIAFINVKTIKGSNEYAKATPSCPPKNIKRKYVFVEKMSPAIIAR